MDDVKQTTADSVDYEHIRKNPGGSEPYLNTPCKEVNRESNDTKGALQHCPRNDVNRTSADHVDYESIRKNEGKIIHNRVLYPSKEDTLT